MSKTKNSTPPKSASTLTAQLRWYLKNCEDTPTQIAQDIDVHHSTLFRFLSRKRGMSLDALDRLAKRLKLRLVCDDR